MKRWLQKIWHSKVSVKRRKRIRQLLTNVFMRERWRSFVSISGSKPIQLDMGRHSWHVDYCADPFLFVWNSDIYIFYETLDKKGKGVLGCFKEMNGSWIQQGKVLEMACHLSYPQVFEECGHVYMIPESFDQGRGEVALFESTDFPFGWEKRATLIPTGYVDSTLLKEDGHYYLACDLIYPKEKAELWHSTNLTGPWERHPQSENISNAARLRRCAGAFLNEGGKLFRIAQDCNGAYGKRVYRVPVLEVSPCEYREGEAELLLDRQFKGKTLARHTYNRIEFGGKQIEVFDVKDYLLQTPWHMIHVLFSLFFHSVVSRIHRHKRKK